MPKKVLIVCYYWPPAGGPGVQRWLTFTKYLPEFEIAPIVYVPENPNYPITDKTLDKEISSKITILKHPIKEPYRIASMLSRKQTKSISSGLVPKKEKQSFLQRIMLYVRGNFFIPDARIGWVEPSVSFLEPYIIENDIDTIITTGPPHSMHLIGMSLKEKINKKRSDKKFRWITDFRDPWTTIGYHDKLKMTAKTKQKHKDLERKVLQNADTIIVTSPTTQKEFKAITEQPIQLITNGFDTAIASLKEQLNNNFILSHIGSLLSERNPKILWKVISELIDENASFKSEFKLRLAGAVSREVLDSIKSYGLDIYLENLGYVSHDDAIKLQRDSDLLLLIEIDATITKGILPGKLYEYLAANRPILALGPVGADIQSIVEQTQSGSYLHYNDEKKLKDTLLSLFNNRTGNQWKSNHEEVKKYHRKSLAAKLSQLLKS